MDRSKHFISQDINLVSYLISKDYRVLSTENNGRFVEFYFPPEIEEEANLWQFSPSDEMRLIQKFLTEKDKILSFLKTKQGR